MPTLQLTDEQVLALVQQLPPERKQAALIALASDGIARREIRLGMVEDRLRAVAADRGRDWDRMTEDEREAFIDDLIHEDRPCGS